MPKLWCFVSSRTLQSRFSLAADFEPEPDLLFLRKWRRKLLSLLLESVVRRVVEHVVVVVVVLVVVVSGGGVVATPA